MNRKIAMSSAWEADVLPFERHPKYPWYPETLQADDVISHGRVVEDRRDPIILVAATQESLVVNVLVKRGNGAYYTNSNKEHLT